MKKLFALALLLATYVVAVPVYYNGTAPANIPRVVDGAPYAFMVADVKLGINDSVFSQVFDAYKVPGLILDSLGQKAMFDTTTSYGATVVSCYDVSDSTGLIDSVLVKVVPQASQYAADGVNPNLPFSGSWDSVGVVVLAAASDLNAQVIGTVRPVISKREARYFRWKIVNQSATSGAPLKNVPRCRVYWSRKTFQR